MLSAEIYLKRIWDKLVAGTSAILAGENHIGEVDCPAGEVSVIPVITAGAYSANDIIGTKMELPNAARLTDKIALLVSIALYDFAKQRPALNIYFFDRNPVNGTYTDNAALDIHDSDLPYYKGHIEIAQTDWVNTLVDNAVGTKKQIGLEMFPYGSRSLWIIMQVTGTPTFASVADLGITFSFLQ